MFINDEFKCSINSSFKEKIKPVGVGVELWKFLRTFYVFLGTSLKPKVRHVQTFCKRMFTVIEPKVVFLNGASMVFFILTR